MLNPEQNNRTNALSIISPILGIFGGIFFLISLFLGFLDTSERPVTWVPIILANLSWFAGLITGIIGLKQTKSKGAQKGNGLATAGVILNGLGCAAGLCFFIFLVGGVAFLAFFVNAYGFLK